MIFPQTLFSTFVAVTLLALSAPARATPAAADAVLVEAEAFSSLGGWSVDTQFVHQMGSPYLLAHGLGVPVSDAQTTIAFAKPGAYRVFVRTKNWVGPWNAPGEPGAFALVIDGQPLETRFGTSGQGWTWQPGGQIKVGRAPVQVALRDLTGFDGRVDAVLFTRNKTYVPPNDSNVLPAWRRKLLKLPPRPGLEQSFDLVVVGGGYAGLGASIAAARLGLKVALIQDRPTLGGNGSSEIRVWAKGNIPQGLYPVGDIINEISDQAKSSPGLPEEFGDDHKAQVAQAEPNLSLFLSHRAFAVHMKSPTQMEQVDAFDVRTSELKRFKAPLFVDATGHGFVGMWAGAERVMEPRGRMGMSNMWRWENTDQPQPFAETPWALNLSESDFPYPRRFHAEWFWESGFDKHPLNDLEEIRDWNLRAVFGAWNAMKNHGAFADKDPNGHANARLTWVAYVGGTRETQQLLGDVVLTREDILAKRSFPDGAVLTTWSIDLHDPNRRYSKRYPDNPFISIDVHGKGVDRQNGYPIPYRCFYSRNIDNLFMAGRNISVTHEALGTVRVMKTLGMVGVVVGRAAAVALDKQTTPRGVYEKHLDSLVAVLKLPGSARRERLSSLSR